MSLQFGNRAAQFLVVDADANAYISGSTRKVSAELNGIVGGTFRGGDVGALVGRLFTGDGADNVRVLDRGSDALLVAFHNSGPTDAILFTNVDHGDAVA